MGMEKIAINPKTVELEGIVIDEVALYL